MDEVFWSRVKMGPGCWTWRGPFFANGFGAYADGGEYVPAHEYALAQSQNTAERLKTIHAIQQGARVWHQCGDRMCVRPSHLLLAD